MSHHSRVAIASSFFVIATSVVAVTGCSKTDAGSAGTASSAQPAASASGEEGRRGHEHDWDGGRDHGDRAH